MNNMIIDSAGIFRERDSGHTFTGTERIHWGMNEEKQREGKRERERERFTWM